ncbi:MAG TPA: hypothetical protein VF261_02155 [Candidatus Saccharimonadales bacterium]
MAEQGTWLLPNLVVGPGDVSRLHRELEALDEYLRQASLRGGEDKADEVRLPKLSRSLDELAGLNKLDLLDEGQRDQAKQFLQALLKHAPVVHVSFAADPSSAFMDKIITWFRQNVHPRLLVRVGLQPTIAAGCVLRTPNHYYDFSLRQHFVHQKSLLLQKLESLENHVGQ